MRKKSILGSKCLTGLLAMSMVLSAVPMSPVFAEEWDYEYEEYEEDGEVDFGVDDGVVTEGDSTTFVIKKFKKFAKEDGKFKDPETYEKYGQLSAEVGTPLRELGLPKNVTVVGYWESNSPEDTEEMELKDLTWELDEEKYDEWEYYDEFSPAATYTFVPDYEAYCIDHGDVDEFVLDDGVKNLKIDVEIKDAASDDISDDDASADGGIDGEDLDDSIDQGIFGDDFTDDFSDDSSDLGTFGDDYDVDTIINQGDPIIMGDDLDTPMTPDEMDAFLGEGVITITETFDDVDEDGNVISTIDEESIFDDLDDDALFGPTDDELDNKDDADLDGQDNPDDNDGTDGNDNDGNDDADNDGIDPDAGDDDMDDDADITPVNIQLVGKLGLTDGFVDYEEAEESTLKSGEDNDIAMEDLPCNMDLTNVKLLLDNTPIVNDLDVSAGDDIVFDYIDDSEETFHFILKVTQKAHRWSETSSCTDIAYCLECGTESGPAGHHTPAGEATCTENDYCLVCGEEIEGSALGHNWKAATCTKPKTCKRCGETSGKKKGHVSNEDATCTENATCEVCGKEIPDTALGHSWKAATCTKPKTCKRCGETSGKKLGHDLGKWTVVEASTDSTHGIQRRYCKREKCDKYEEDYLNIIADPARNYISGIEPGADYNPKTRIAFNAVGAGYANKSPIKGDIRYVPSTWSIQGQPGTFINGYEGAFSITQKGTYTVTVSYQQQSYDGNTWVSTNTADSKSVSFTVGGVKDNGASNAVHINPQTGDDTPIIPIVIALIAALAGILGIILFKTRKK